jgi:polysaccharide biosynthesis/export protein
MLSLGGCEVFPASGPAARDIKAVEDQDSANPPFAVVRLNAQIVKVLAAETPRLSSAFVDRRPPNEIRLGVGDVVAITLFEAGAGGLLIPAESGARPGNFVTLPNQTVDSKGYITVPYAPPILAKGKTTTDVQRAIVEALKNRAIEPQVIVTLQDQRTSLINVLGEVNTPARFPANAAGEHILDAITRAGGTKSQGFDTWVLLERGGKRASVPFGALVYEPSNNIFVHPNDTVYLYREPLTFVAFGASGKQGQYPFDAWRISLAEAVGKTGGLNDDKADPASVFLYRGETRAVAEKLGVETAKFGGALIPIIYVADFRNPEGYFFAKEFPMRNKDVIYVSNSLATETSKAILYFQSLMQAVNYPLIASNNALIVRELLQGSTVLTTSTNTVVR